MIAASVDGRPSLLLVTFVIGNGGAITLLRERKYSPQWMLEVFWEYIKHFSNLKGINFREN